MVCMVIIELHIGLPKTHCIATVYHIPSLHASFGRGIKTGGWTGLSRDERICKNCAEGEVEDVRHFLLHCMFAERKQMERLMKEGVKGWWWTRHVKVLVYDGQ